MTKPSWLNKYISANTTPKRQVTIIDPMSPEAYPGHQRFSTGEYTGAGEDGRVQPYMPTGIISRGGKPAIIDEGEYKTDRGGIVPAEVVSALGGAGKIDQALRAHRLMQMKNNGVQSYATGAEEEEIDINKTNATPVTNTVTMPNLSSPATIAPVPTNTITMPNTTASPTAVAAPAPLTMAPPPKSTYDKNEAIANQMLREQKDIATGESDVYKKIQEQTFRALNPMLQTQQSASAMNVAASPNMTTGAKQTAIAESYKNIGEQQSAAATDIAKKGMEMATTASQTAFNMAQNLRTYSDNKKEYENTKNWTRYEKALQTESWDEAARLYKEMTGSDINLDSMKEYAEISKASKETGLAIDKANALISIGTPESMSAAAQLIGEATGVQIDVSTVADEAARKVLTNATTSLTSLVATGAPNEVLESSAESFLKAAYGGLSTSAIADKWNAAKKDGRSDWTADQVIDTTIDGFKTQNDPVAKYVDSLSEVFADELDTPEEVKEAKKFFTSLQTSGGLKWNSDTQTFDIDETATLPWQSNTESHKYLKNADGSYVTGWDDASYNARDAYVRQAKADGDSPVSLDTWKSAYDDVMQDFASGEFSGDINKEIISRASTPRNVSSLTEVSDIDIGDKVKWMDTEGTLLKKTTFSSSGGIPLSYYTVKKPDGEIVFLQHNTGNGIDSVMTKSQIRAYVQSVEAKQQKLLEANGGTLYRTEPKLYTATLLRDKATYEKYQAEIQEYKKLLQQGA